MTMNLEKAKQQMKQKSKKDSIVIFQCPEESLAIRKDQIRSIDIQTNGQTIITYIDGTHQTLQIEPIEQQDLNKVLLTAMN